MPNQRYLATGLALVSLMVGAVLGARRLHGVPPLLEKEPWKERGNPAATTTIVVFSDFQCPYCEGMHEKLNTLAAENPNRLRLVFKHYPLSAHAHAMPAAIAAECAGQQNRFWEYHDLLFGRVNWRRASDSRPFFLQYAAELHLDPAQFSACLESPQAKAVVLRNKKEGDELFIHGTPTLFLNGTQLITNYDLAKLRKLVQDQIGPPEAASR